MYDNEPKSIGRYVSPPEKMTFRTPSGIVIDFSKKINPLTQPFEEKHVEWRIGKAFYGETEQQNSYLLLAYLDARAVQRRLDEIFTPFGWRDEYRQEGSGFVCRLCVLINGMWVCKENGSSETNMEAYKGGISSAFKRVASSGFGIGRYLYNLGDTWADHTYDKVGAKEKGYVNRSYDSKIKKAVLFRTPQLGAMFLPTPPDLIEKLRSEIMELGNDDDLHAGIISKPNEVLNSIIKKNDVSSLDMLLYGQWKSAMDFVVGLKRMEENESD
jgi:hypothetical protein